MTQTYSLQWSIVILLSGIAALVMTFVDLATPLRLVPILWFLLVCPGMALVRLLRIENPLAQWSMAIGLSLTLDTLIAYTLAATGFWLPPIGLVALVIISLVGVVAQLAV